VEMVLINGELTLEKAKRLQRIDIFFGIAAIVVLIVGLHRVFLFEKGWDYYSGSAFFWAKMSLFVIVGLMSAVPTIEFFSWRKATGQGQMPTVAPAKVRMLRGIMHAELLGVVLIILCAAMMARGVELF